MLVQEQLRQYGPEHLSNTLGIKFTYGDDNRVILNYNQIDSPKNHPVVKECRGLVLDKTDRS